MIRGAFFGMWALLAGVFAHAAGGEYVIRGYLPHLQDDAEELGVDRPEKIYLYHDFAYIDSAEFQEWAFEFRGEVEGEYVLDAYLTVPGLEQFFFFPVFLEPGEITVEVYDLPEEDMFIVLARGTPSNDLVSERFRTFAESPYRVIEIYRDTTLSFDAADRMAYAEIMRQDSLVRHFYRDNREADIAPYLVVNDFYETNRWNELRAEYRYLQEKFPGHPGLHNVETVLLMMPGALPGTAAPEFTLPDENGAAVSLLDFRGSYVLLDFWSSVSGPNLDDFKKLARFPEFIKGVPVVRIGISTDRYPETWEKTLKKYRPSGVQIIDRDHEVSRAYHLTAYPARFLIDPEGTIVAKGRFTGLEEIVFPEAESGEGFTDEGLISWE